MKLQNLFASVGGFINFLKLGISLVFGTYFENNYYNGLNSNFFEFKEKAKTDSFQSRKLPDDSILTNNFTKIAQNPQNPKTLKLSKLEMFLGTTICIIFNKKRKKHFEDWRILMNIIKNKLDVVSLIKTQFDLAKMRYFLFSKKQNSMFNKLNVIQINSEVEYHNFVIDPKTLKEENIDALDLDDISKRIREVM